MSCTHIYDKRQPMICTLVLASIVMLVLPVYATNGDTWSNGFESVWHLKETGFPYADSVGGNNNATTGDAPSQANGKIGKGQSLDGVADNLELGTIDFGDHFTLSAWVNVDSGAAENIQTIMSSKDDPGALGYYNHLILADLNNDEKPGIFLAEEARNCAVTLIQDGSGFSFVQTSFPLFPTRRFKRLHLNNLLNRSALCLQQ